MKPPSALEAERKSTLHDVISFIYVISSDFTETLQLKDEVTLWQELTLARRLLAETRWRNYSWSQTSWHKKETSADG